MSPNSFRGRRSTPRQGRKLSKSWKHTWKFGRWVHWEVRLFSGSFGTRRHTSILGCQWHSTWWPQIPPSFCVGNCMRSEISCAISESLIHVFFKVLPFVLPVSARWSAHIVQTDEAQDQTPRCSPVRELTCQRQIWATETVVFDECFMNACEKVKYFNSILVTSLLSRFDVQPEGSGLLVTQTKGLQLSISFLACFSSSLGTFFTLKWLRGVEILTATFLALVSPWQKFEPRFETWDRMHLRLLKISAVFPHKYV